MCVESFRMFFIHSFYEILLGTDVDKLGPVFLDSVVQTHFHSFGYINNRTLFVHHISSVSFKVLSHSGNAGYKSKTHLNGCEGNSKMVYFICRSRLGIPNFVAIFGLSDRDCRSITAKPTDKSCRRKEHSQTLKRIDEL